MKLDFGSLNAGDDDDEEFHLDTGLAD